MAPLSGKDQPRPRLRRNHTPNEPRITNTITAQHSALNTATTPHPG